MASSKMTVMDQLNSEVERFRSKSDALQALDVYRNALASILAQIEAASQDYSQRYSQIQRLQYDSEGNVEDVTPGNNLGYATAAYSKAKQAVADLAAEADVARRQFESATELKPFVKVTELLGYVRQCNLSRQYPCIPFTMRWNIDKPREATAIQRGFASPRLPSITSGFVNVQATEDELWDPNQVPQDQSCVKHGFAAIDYQYSGTGRYRTGAEVWVETSRLSDRTIQDMVMLLGAAIIVKVHSVTYSNSSHTSQVSWEAFHSAGKFSDMQNNEYEVADPVHTRGCINFSGGSTYDGTSIVGLQFSFTTGSNRFELTGVCFKHSGTDYQWQTTSANGKIPCLDAGQPSVVTDIVEDFPSKAEGVVDITSEESYSTPVSNILPDATNLITALDSIDTTPQP